MEFEFKLKEVQASLVEDEIDGWLLFDYHHSNPRLTLFWKFPLEKR